MSHAIVVCVCVSKCVCEALDVSVPIKKKGFPHCPRICFVRSATKFSEKIYPTKIPWVG